MGKTLLLLLATLLILPSAALADSDVAFSSVGGVFAVTSNGLTLTGANMISLRGLDGGPRIAADSLGSVSFATGPLTNGSINAPGLFFGGGFFTVTGNGTNGVPDGVLFTGVFGSAGWTMATIADGSHVYTMNGRLNGTLIGGLSVTDVPMKVTINTGQAFFTSPVTHSDSIMIIPMPEPDSISLLGTGLLGLAGLSFKGLRS